ncbi:MAG: ABC transporter permease [Lachnospiraceae bacterium]|nr:ABC transporter permease [Lachnospiraceae bacterium]
MLPKVSSAQSAFVRQYKQQKIFIKLCQIFILVFFLTIWEIAANSDWIDGFIFSSPSRICKTFYQMCVDGSFFLHLGTTLAEVFISFTLIVGIGYSVAVLLWFFPKLSKILEPYFVVLNSLPKSALAPLLIVWLGANVRTIIVAGISVAIFGTILSLYTAFVESDSEDQLLIYTLHGTKRHVLTKVLFPSTLPTLISLMKVNIGLALVGVIIGEFLAARQGLGYLIIYGSQVFKLDMVILSIVVLCIVAVGLYQLIQMLERRLSRS